MKLNKSEKDTVVSSTIDKKEAVVIFNYSQVKLHSF